VTLLAAFTTDLSISTSRHEGSARIALTGNFKGYPVRSCVFFSADTAEHLDCVVKTEDLALACCALTGESLTIRATESGLIVQGVGHEGNKQFLLRRFDPQG
jgi:hypothetical protein